MANSAARARLSRPTNKSNLGSFPTALAETIYQRSLALPESAAREVLDFIEFLEQRYGQPATLATDDQQKRQAALAHIATRRVPWKGKPIPNRDAFYDDARD